MLCRRNRTSSGAPKAPLPYYQHTPCQSLIYRPVHRLTHNPHINVSIRLAPRILGPIPTPSRSYSHGSSAVREKSNIHWGAEGACTVLPALFRQAPKYARAHLLTQTPYINVRFGLAPRLLKPIPTSSQMCKGRSGAVREESNIHSGASGTFTVRPAHSGQAPKHGFVHRLTRNPYIDVRRFYHQDFYGLYQPPPNIIHVALVATSSQVEQRSLWCRLRGIEHTLGSQRHLYRTTSTLQPGTKIWSRTSRHAKFID